MLRVVASVAFLWISTALVFLPVDSGFLTSSPNHRPKQRRPQTITTTTTTAATSATTIAPSQTIPPNKPSIGIIGSGAVGCYYGARLWQTKRFDVKFHMRGEHLHASRYSGLRVDSIEGDMFLPPEDMRSMAYGEVEDMGKVDWVLLCLKSTALADREGVRSLLLPLLHEKTRIVAVMNGMVDEDIVRIVEGDDGHGAAVPDLTRCAATYAGMALLCSNRIRPGYVAHTYAGGLTASLAFSSSSSRDGDSSQQSHEDAVRDLFRTTHGFPFTYEHNLTRARWSKMLWNLPFNGISVAMGGITIDEVVGDEGLREMVWGIMDETVRVANRDLKVRGYGEECFLGTLEKQKMMDLSDGMGDYSTSTMLDLIHRRPMEVQYLFRKALEQADQLEVPAPILITLTALIAARQNLLRGI